MVPMIRDAPATKARILEAAGIEFATYGLAGARVDRLAALAGANKERIYANFGSKEALFDATVAANIEELLDTVPFDADDLPGYAVRMFDFTLTHPRLVRLALWHSLERPGLLERLPQTVESTERKVELLAAAQGTGLVDDTLPPERLFDFTIDHPHLLRLALWHSLERPGRLEELPESADSMAQKVSALRDAQRRGIVDDSVPAELLTTLILGIVHAGLILAPTPDNHADLAGLRAATRLAVSRLTAPRAP